jgi:GDP-4-dehydro-6-deoxy-D-mannose reductase
VCSVARASTHLWIGGLESQQPGLQSTAPKGSLTGLRIFITGSTGFVGGWLGQELAHAYSDALLFGTAHHDDEPRDALPPHTVVRTTNLLDKDALKAFLDEAQPDVVFHLAGFASAAGTDRDKIFRVNVDGTVGLLELLAETGRPCRVHLASSGYVYGATMPGRPAQEDDSLTPQGSYAESKAAMEEASKPFSEGTNLSITVTRSFNHTGPRQGTEFVIPTFARQIARIEKGLDEPVVRHGNLEAKRDFLHVRDVVRAYRLLLCETKPQPWRVVNVASGVPAVIRDVLDELIRQARVPVRTEADPARMRPSDMPECIGDPSALTALTGWQPEILLSQTLAETLDYWRGVTPAEPVNK